MSLSYIYIVLIFQNFFQEIKVSLSSGSTDFLLIAWTEVSHDIYYFTPEIMYQSCAELESKDRSRRELLTNELKKCPWTTKI